MRKHLLITACLGLLVFGCDPPESGGFMQLPDSGAAGGEGGQGGAGAAGGEGGAGAAGGAGGEGGAGAAGGEGGAGAAGGEGGAGGMGGGEGGEGGAGGDGGMGGGEGGAGGEGGMGGEGGGEVPMGPTPTYAQAATATVGERTYVAWSVEGTVWLRIIDFDGSFTGPAEALAMVDAAWVSALTVDGIPWIIYGTADGTLMAAKGDEPEAPALDLGLTGKPLLAKLGRQLMVLGVGPQGDVARQLLTGAPGEVVGEPISFDGLPVPESAAEVAGGVVMRFSGPGQCVFIDDGDGMPTGNFPCQAGEGRLLTDGARALVSYLRVDGDNNTLLSLVPTFGFADTFTLGGVAIPELLGFQNDNGVRAAPVLARLRADDNRSGNTELLLIEPERLRRSAQSWVNWPYPTARAVVGRDGEALVLVFGTDDDPRVESIDLIDFEFGPEPYGFEVDESCVPEVETCDGEDQDCDDQVDNGLCCNNFGASESVGFGLPGDERPLQWLSTDLRGQDGYYFMIRTEPDYWVLRFQSFVRRNGILPDVSDPPGLYEIRGAYEGHSFHTAGGHNALIARNEDGAWHIFWTYRSVIDPPLKAPVPIPCDEILAVDTFSHIEPNSLMIACNDRFITAFPREDREDEVTLYSELQIDSAAWATITRAGDNLRTLILGHEDSLGAATVSAFSVPINGRIRPVDLPDDVRELDELLPGAPVYRPFPFNRPYVQIREATEDAPMRARAQVKRTGTTWEWVELLGGPNPTRMRFAQTVSKLVMSSDIGTEEEPLTGFWVIDIAEHDELNLWSTEPAFTVDREVLHWDVSQGNYLDYIVFFTPPVGNRLYHYNSRRVECRLR